MSGADPRVPPVTTAAAAENGTVAIAPPTSVPGTATVTVTSEDGSHTTTYTVDLVTIAFSRHIGQSEPLRTGPYRQTLTFTLSSTTP